MTAANAHTPGPWTAECYRHGGFDIRANLDGESAIIASRSSWGERADEMLANARLIASAPALLEALQRLMARLDDHFGGDPAQDWKEQEDARRILSQAQKGTP